MTKVLSGFGLRDSKRSWFLEEKGNNQAVCTMVPSPTEEGDIRPWKVTFLSIRPTILLTAFYMILVNPVLKNLYLHCKPFICTLCSVYDTITCISHFKCF